MTDLFAKFCAINLQLQVDNLNLIITKLVTSALLKKFILRKPKFGGKEFSQFPILLDLHRKNEISFSNTQVYSQHFESQSKDFTERFEIFYPWKSLNGS